MKFLVLSAVAAVAAAGVAPKPECTRLYVEEYAVVYKEQKTLACAKPAAIVAEAPEVQFYYDADNAWLVSDQKKDGEYQCLSADEEDDGTFTVDLEECKDKASRHWKLIKGNKWLNEKACQCLAVDGDNLVFVDCAEAAKCELDKQQIEYAVAECQKPACDADRACPLNCECKDNMCWAPYECYKNSDCEYGQECQKGWCVYRRPYCLVNDDCPYPYVCDQTCGQCVRPSKTCPEGFHLEGYYCVPDFTPECGRDGPFCPDGQRCEHHQCVTVDEKVCDVAEDCPSTDYICSGNRCVKACPLADCVKCERGVCLDNPCAELTCEFGCTNGVCNADPCAELTCEFGCTNGVCNADPCAEQTCEFGCTNGVCNADPCAELTCELGCTNGACNIE